MFSLVRKVVLPNGLTVLVKPDRRLDLACVLTWVGAGYFDEPDDLCGISHFIEHLFFKGTLKRGVGEIAKETKRLGGYLNAATIYDQTYYFTVIPSGSLAQALDVQADALINPAFDPAEMEREKEVIIQEVKRKYDNPNPFAWEKLLEMSFDHHPLRRWRMGDEEQIRSYTREQVIDYYEEYYQPSNIEIIVTGNVNPDETLELIDKAYGIMSDGAEILRRKTIEETEQIRPRLHRITGDVQRALLKMGFRAPSLLHDDHHAMIFLNTLMGRGRSSRLYRSLREEKALAMSVGASLYGSKDVGYLTLEAELPPERLADCEEQLWLELDRLRRDPPTLAEVKKIRRIIETNFFAESEDLMGQAYSLAYFETLGGYETAKDYLHSIRAVNPADIVRVAGKYCSFPKMNLLEYVPESFGKGSPSEWRLTSMEKRLASQIEKAGSPIGCEEMEPLPDMILPSGNTQPLGKSIEKLVLEDGPTSLFLQTKALPLVNISVVFPGGRLDETSENCGITQLTLKSMLKGTEECGAEELAFEMESLGTSIRFEANADSFGFSMNLLSENVDRGAELLSQILLKPGFREAEVARERELALSEIRKASDDMFRYPIELFYEALYGMHPYGLPRNGNEKAISAVDRNQLLDWYDQTFRWGRMHIAIIGDLEKDRATDLIQEHFSVERDSEELNRADIYPVIPNRGVREAIEDRDRHQTGFALGFQSYPMKGKDFYVAEVLQNVLSGMGGRLFSALREERGLAYTVTAFNIGLLRSGAFFAYTATSPKKEGEARLGLLREFKRMREMRPTDQELEAAKAFSKGSYSMGLQGNRPLSDVLLQHELVGKGVEDFSRHGEYIDRVTADDVQRVAREIFDLDNYAIGIVRGTR